MASQRQSHFKQWAWAGSLLFLLLAAAQFIRPELANPPVTAEWQAPPEVRQVLRQSCYACHSNETSLSWFDEVVPAYWLVARDVKEARAHLNFSEIGGLPDGQQEAILYDAVNKIQLGAMPLPSYLHAHPGATVSPAALQTLRAYLNTSEDYKEADVTAIRSSDAEYNNWIHAANHSTEVRPEPNGIAFLPDYKNWKTISSTERFDNHTIREILGTTLLSRPSLTGTLIPGLMEQRLPRWRGQCNLTIPGSLIRANSFRWNS